MRSSPATMIQHFVSRPGVSSGASLQPPPRVISVGPDSPQQQLQGTLTYKSPYEER